MDLQRLEKELPLACSWGWQFHHIGIPTSEKRPNERYIPHLKMYVSGFETSPFGVEWMRFEVDSPIHSLVQEVSHVAFQVKNIEEALEVSDCEILTPPNSPTEGIRVAMIKHNGAPVELIEFVEE